ncbi:hypothetical protein NXH76_08350 [Blautia schinkii]|nr:hypothetical protein [Blautia schinkii]
MAHIRILKTNGKQSYRHAILKFIPVIGLIGLLLAVPLDEAYQANIGGIRGLKIVKELPYIEVLPQKPEYKIGLASNNRIVFIDKEKALDSIREDIPDAFSAIKKEWHLSKLSKWNWKEYEIYGWQTSYENEQGRILCEFVSIYSNSFKK